LAEDEDVDGCTGVPVGDKRLVRHECAPHDGGATGVAGVVITSFLHA
jgi:hypothetical protein